MQREGDWRGWQEIADPPQWVLQATAAWFGEQQSRPYGEVVSFPGEVVDYRVWFETGEEGRIHAHYYKKLNQPGGGRTAGLARKALLPAAIVLAICCIAVFGGAVLSFAGGLLDTGSPAERPQAENTAVAAADLETGPISLQYPYRLKGRPGLVGFDAYAGVSAYFSSQYPKDYDTYAEHYRQFVASDVQKTYLRNLVENIRASAETDDDRVRVAISMVQHIPYKDYPHDTFAKYPYHVLYHNNGDCDEKALLLALLLGEMGYGSAVFVFEDEAHMAAGIKVPAKYAYKDSGYAFIESTAPGIPTDAAGELDGGIHLASDPVVVEIADGASFDGIWKEYQDAKEWNALRSMGSPLDQYHYGRWQSLVNYYGIRVEG